MCEGIKYVAAADTVVFCTMNLTNLLLGHLWWWPGSKDAKYNYPQNIISLTTRENERPESWVQSADLTLFAEDCVCVCMRL